MPRLWRFVTSTRTVRPAGKERAWLCELDCGHTQQRWLRHQRTAPVRLACSVCERERDEALRPEWHRAALRRVA